MVDDDRMLRRELERVTDSAETARRRAGDVERRVDELVREVSSLTEQLTDTDETVAATTTGVNALRGEMQQVATQVEWLTRVVMAGNDESEIDLDEIDGEDSERLVGLIRAGDEARRGLANEDTMTSWTKMVEKVDDLEAQVNNQLHEAVVLSHAVLTARENERMYADWDGNFGGVHLRYIATKEQLKTARRDAAGAKRKLEAERRRRDEVDDVITAGREADEQLRQSRRARIEQAVIGNGHLPYWFTHALGHAPPQDQTDAWMKTAVAVTVYRAVHHVRDPVQALGPTPAEHERTHTEHATLWQQIQNVTWTG